MLAPLSVLTTTDAPFLRLRLRIVGELFSTTVAWAPQTTASNWVSARLSGVSGRHQFVFGVGPLQSPSSPTHSLIMAAPVCGTSHSSGTPLPSQSASQPSG